jgi:hypothetical protein
VSEFSNPLINQDQSNPLAADPALFDMYMSALDIVLAEPEIRGTFDEFGLSAATLRMQMVSIARRVLQASSEEFASYQAELARELDTTDINPNHITYGSNLEPTAILRLLWIGLGSVGAFTLVGGLASLAAWSGAQSLIWAGGTLVAAAFLLCGAVQLLKTEIGFRLLRGDGSPELSIARNRLIEAVSETELLAQVRTFLNTGRRGRFGHTYNVSGSPGLSEIYNKADRVPTSTAVELEGLLGRFDGASIGVAGPRGSGKSTLIREYCEGVNADRDYSIVSWSQLLGLYVPRRVPSDLRCMGCRAR